MCSDLIVSHCTIQPYAIGSDLEGAQGQFGWNTLDTSVNEEIQRKYSHVDRKIRSPIRWRKGGRWAVCQDHFRQSISTHFLGVGRQEILLDFQVRPQSLV